MIHPGDRLENPVTGEVLIFHRTSEETGGESLLVETIVRPRGFVAAAHVHPYQTERFEVLEGLLGLRVEDKELLAKPGDVALVPPGGAAPLLERGRGRGALPLRGAPRASIRVADRDDVHARRRGQDQPQGEAEPAPARGDREGPLRHRPPPVPTGRAAACGARGRRSTRALVRIPGDGEAGRPPRRPPVRARRRPMTARKPYGRESG
jgi:uncharacterized cupin superfamily protein